MVTDDGESWDISYADGSGASGVVYADKVVIGGVTATVSIPIISTLPEYGIPELSHRLTLALGRLVEV